MLSDVCGMIGSVRYTQMLRHAFARGAIGRLNITVNNVVLMSVAKRAAELNYGIQLLLQRDGSTRGDDRFQALPFQVLHHHVGIAVLIAQVALAVRGHCTRGYGGGGFGPPRGS